MTSDTLESFLKRKHIELHACQTVYVHCTYISIPVCDFVLPIFFTNIVKHARTVDTYPIWSIRNANQFFGGNINSKANWYFPYSFHQTVNREYLLVLSDYLIYALAHFPEISCEFPPLSACTWRHCYFHSHFSVPRRLCRNGALSP